MQYGNSICGVESMSIKIDIVTDVDGKLFTYDLHGNQNLGDDGFPVLSNTIRKWLKPTVRMMKSTSIDTLVDRISKNTTVVPEGSFAVVLSHKNLDNIAKYHILNRSSNLYYDGSLPKNGENMYKFSDFKFNR